MTAQIRADRDDDRLTVNDAPGHFGAHEQTVRGWNHRGELRASKFGNRIVYHIRRTDYDDFLRQLLSLGANELVPASGDADSLLQDRTSVPMLQPSQ